MLIVYIAVQLCRVPPFDLDVITCSRPIYMYGNTQPWLIDHELAMATLNHGWQLTSNERIPNTAAEI